MYMRHSYVQGCKEMQTKGKKSDIYTIENGLERIGMHVKCHGDQKARHPTEVLGV